MGESGSESAVDYNKLAVGVITALSLELLISLVCFAVEEGEYQLPV